MTIYDDEEFSMVNKHLLGNSVTSEYVYNHVAFNMEQDVVKHVCLLLNYAQSRLIQRLTFAFF